MKQAGKNVTRVPALNWIVGGLPEETIKKCEGIALLFGAMMQVRAEVRLPFNELESDACAAVLFTAMDALSYERRRLEAARRAKS